jgi:hypothetical protein
LRAPGSSRPRPNSPRSVASPRGRLARSPAADDRSAPGNRRTGCSGR